MKSLAIDTDIGTDIDDLLAITMALGSPELNIAAITTVHGDVELRARIAAKAFAVAGRPAPPITPGLSATRSGRDVVWLEHEGSTIEDLAEQGYHAPRSAVDELAGTGTIAAIAPLTNVAAAVERPDHRVQEIFMMGGFFGPDRIEHNIQCDVAAADVVFRSGVKATVIGFEQTERSRLDDADRERIAQAGPLGRMINAEMLRFWQFSGHRFNSPHDPLAVLMIARPELFEFTTGHISVQTSGELAGRTTLAADATGPHRIVTDYDLPTVRHEIVDRIIAVGPVASNGRGTR